MNATLKAAPTHRSPWPGWLFASGLGVLLLVGVLLGASPSVGGPARSADAASDATLGTLALPRPELAPPPQSQAQPIPLPGLSSAGLAVLVGLGLLAWSWSFVAWLLARRPVRFPPGRRGRASLYAYLN